MFESEELEYEVIKLIRQCEQIEKELDGYCEYMKNMFLATSGVN
jgi:hypothetical protein